jgi:hypothetical protein
VFVAVLIIFVIGLSSGPMRTLVRHPAAWLCLVAVVCSFLDRALRARRPAVPKQPAFAPTLFVAVVSYCDAAWGPMVQAFLQNAKHPETLRIGVLEYIRTVDDTLEPRLPRDWRARVHVYSVSHRTATTLRRAQRLCIDQLYAQEPVVVLTSACEPVPGWDDAVREHASKARVVCTRPSATANEATFPCLTPRVTQRRLLAAVATRRAVPSVVFQHEFAIVPGGQVDTALSATHPLTVTARLARAGVGVAVPTIPLARRLDRPASVPPGRARRIEAEAVAYVHRECGFERDDEQPSVYARLGLTRSAGSEEMIAKYGSVLGARLAIQEEAHRDARRGRTVAA